MVTEVKSRFDEMVYGAQDSRFVAVRELYL
jgi:hypothetical protein